jgi:EAL domain-containing protein (putative c-di-GMP-specific phosphodiesterase class I)
VLTIETALPGAAARGELHAVFQAQVDLQSGRTVAAEALCRWHHLDLGAVAPNDFIPAAEDSGLIDEVGLFMADEALAALQRWELDVSVNVSPVQLSSSMFTEWLAQRLYSTGLDGGRLTLEITESRPIADVAAVLRRLEPLRGLGVGVALDDFGIGHASIRQLKRLHGSEVKLDRSLATDPSEAARAKLTEVVALAHAAAIRVVAEGIETLEQLRRVRDLGCDRAQGYLFGRPMAVDEFSLSIG